MTKNITILKLIFSVLLLGCYSTTAMAQKQKKIDPAKFQAELEQFITSEVALSPFEAAAFFPIYREMRAKQLAYFGEERRLRCVDTSNDKACAEAIRKRDKNDLEVKILQQTYHERFMTILPASKVFRILRAEDKFHRRLFTNERNGKKTKCLGKSEQKRHKK